MFAVLKAVLGWMTGGGIAAIGEQLRQARLDSLNEQNSEQRIIADLRVKELEFQQEAARNALELRRETAGFWEMRLITFVIAGCFAFHLLLVTIDTCFRLGWGIPAYPPPFDQWQGAILLSFFGVQVVGQGITAIAGAIRGRR
jgi:hypothetical protein